MAKHLPPEIVARLQTAADRVKDALWPSVLPLLAKPHGEDLSVMGSGVLVKIGSELFIFTAAHVFKHFEASILTGVGDELVALEGEAFSPTTGQVQEGLDAGVVRLRPEAARLGLQFLELPQIDPCADRLTSDCLLLGFPWRRTKLRERVIRSSRDALASITLEHDAYASLGFDPARDLLIRQNKHWKVRGANQNPWSLEGCSGGGLWALDPQAPKLMATFTGTASGGSMMLGTRVCVHLAMVGQRLPELLPLIVECPTQ